MVGFALGFLKQYWKLFAIAAVVLSVAYAINLMLGNYNKAIEDAITQKQRADAWETTSGKWEDAFHKSEDLREQEARSMVSGFEREKLACNQRVAAIAKAKDRINVITRTVPSENNQICPAAGIITSDELRFAIGAK